MKRSSIAALLQLPDTAAAIVHRRVEDHLEFLLVGTSAGRWTFPRGRIESGEQLADAARREALEEAGAAGDLRDEPLITYRSHRRMEDGRRVPILVTAFLLAAETFTDPTEHRRAPHWFSSFDARRALASGRTPSEAAELSRVIDAAIRAAVVPSP